ncbi:beta-ketoacyl synthase N-terminal-like domain-containing protein [Aquirhabdus sp.]|uniref:beta-ketoacyl synthase N-terminal-like domain-containing protein n=1 Tax=Aquirhabdus sp. TaxID=2824160 RepID=UPI00396C784E
MKKNQSELCFSAMAGVFPGADSVEVLWQRILHADIAPLTPLPARWHISRDAIYSPIPKQLNKIYLDQGYCLPMDNDQVIAAAWGRQTQITQKVIKDLMRDACSQSSAGEIFDGEATALVMGTSWSDESYFMAGGKNHQSQAWFDLTDYQVLAESLGIRGPVIAIDTACSSFAYAIDTAQKLIKTGQAQRAIVAGINAFLPPALFLGFSQLGALSVSGRIRSFGHDADGIVPGECVAAFLLEPLQDALQANRKPLAVLKGLGISSDGAEGSIFSPGKLAQIKAYKRAYQDVDPVQIDYIEAHGTGTLVGDTTELESLEAFFKPHRHSVETRLPIGSLKSIIGHTLAASGAASLAKVLLMLRHRMIPPHVSVQPHKLLEDSCLQLPTQGKAFSQRDTPLRIGISSFGFGGANAHLIVEEVPKHQVKKSKSTVKTSRPAVQILDLAITHLDATFAVAPSNTAWQQGILTAKFATEQSFPVSRFDTASVAMHGSAPLVGHFFHDTMTIDIANFRMGPKQLAYVDAFKLLVTSRCKTMLRENILAGNLSDTALVMCANMGGEHFFDLYKKIDNYFGGDEHSAPDIIVDDVGTMLPTMVSGYPTRVLDLQGFHQTLSGASGLFWNALRNAPAWLGDCRTLVLGAGHYINCSADALRASSHPITHGEGVGLLVAKPYQSALNNQEKILAKLTCVVDAVITKNIEEACVLAKASLTGLAIEICELQPDTMHPLQGAQKYTGFLSEATGIESLAAAVYGPDLNVAIEVRLKGQPQFWLFLEKEKLVTTTEDIPVTLPLEIRFSRAIESELLVEQSIQAPITAAIPTVAQLSDHELYPARDLGWMIDANNALVESLQTSLRVRAQLLQRLHQSSVLSPVQRLEPSQPLAPLHRLIDQPVHTPFGSSTFLHVNENHPYFFDHALDHVPGILLLGGILQLVDQYKADSFAGVTFVKSIDIQFKRYAEKTLPIQITLKKVTATAYEVSVTQNQNLLCSCNVGVALVMSRLSAHGISAKPCQQQHLLHKARPENILVSDILECDSEISVKTCALPPDHYLAQGDSSSLSILYFLEVARQCFMLVAHEKLDIPVGMPMNLLHLRFELNAPIPRHSTLELIPTHQLERWTGLLQTGQVNIKLRHASEVIGSADITSQVINKEIYALQRKHTA